MISAIHPILFVADQRRSRDFYAFVLEIEPCLDVPGMTEFPLQPGCRLGLMPRAGAERLLGALGAAGCEGELYCFVDEPGAYAARALSAGAELVSALQLRNWGDEAVYLRDPDGHLLAFARRA